MYHSHRDFFLFFPTQIHTELKVPVDENGLLLLYGGNLHMIYTYYAIQTYDMYLLCYTYI